MSKLRLGSVLAAVGALAALAFAVTALGGTAKHEATTIAVTAGKPAEFRFTFVPKTAKKGVVTFKVTNKGKISHNLKVGNKKTATLAAGKSATLRVTFAKAGAYPYLCTLPAHAQAGMKGVLVVK